MLYICISLLKVDRGNKDSPVYAPKTVTVRFKIIYLI